MFRTLTLLVLAGLLVLVGGAPAAPHTKAAVDKGSAAKVTAQYEATGMRMVRSIAAVGAPLQNLNQEQRAAVAALLVMSRIVGQHEAATSTSGSSLSRAFWTEVSGICPAPAQIEFTRGGCLDAEISYVSAMAKCLDGGKTESECDQETWPEMTAALYCEMKQIEELGGIIGKIPGGKWSPEPFPWPAESPGPNPKPH